MSTRYRPRALAPSLTAAARAFPAIVLTGPRRAGKTFLLRHVFPAASYLLLEDPDVVARLRADPQGFLDGLEGPCILDEVQNVTDRSVLSRLLVGIGDALSHTEPVTDVAGVAHDKTVPLAVYLTCLPEFTDRATSTAGSTFARRFHAPSVKRCR